MEIVDTARPDMWMLSTYVGAWVAGQVHLFADGTLCRAAICQSTQYVLSWPVALLVLVVVVGPVVVAAFATFRKRDLA